MEIIINNKILGYILVSFLSFHLNTEFFQNFALKNKFYECYIRDIIFVSY